VNTKNRAGTEKHGGGLDFRNLRMGMVAKMRFIKKYETGKFLDKWFLEIAISLLVFEKTLREFAFLICAKLKKPLR
jgi:hypothetical protein